MAITFDVDTFAERYLQKRFLITYFIVFLILCFILSFVRFLGKWPILIIITFYLTIYLQKRYGWSD